MPNDKEHFVGSDVAKDWFDGAVLGEKGTKQFADTKRGIGELVKWMTILQPPLIVVEATGGYASLTYPHFPTPKNTTTALTFKIVAACCVSLP